MKSDDYHDEMNRNHFVEWFQKQLLPNLPKHSFIVVDNAPYHNVVEEKIPTKSSRKGEMQALLTKHNIEWEPKDLRRELFQKILSVGASLARQTGHTILRLPVAHCELNAIELDWEQVKDFARKSHKTFRLADIEKLIPAAFEEITRERWKPCCEHAIKED